VLLRKFNKCNTDVKLCLFKAYCTFYGICYLYNVTVMQRFEAAYVKCVKNVFWFIYARLDIIPSMFFFIWVFLQLALSFTMPGEDLLPAFRVIIASSHHYSVIRLVHAFCAF